MSRIATPMAAIVLDLRSGSGGGGSGVLMCATIARMSPAAVLFDNDGLTLDTEQAWTRAEELLFRHGAAFTDDHKRDLLGHPRRVARPKLERDARPSRARARRRALRARHGRARPRAPADARGRRARRRAARRRHARWGWPRTRRAGSSTGLAVAGPRGRLRRDRGRRRGRAAQAGARRLPGGRRGARAPSRRTASPSRTRPRASPPRARPGRDASACPRSRASCSTADLVAASLHDPRGWRRWGSRRRPPRLDRVPLASPAPASGVLRRRRQVLLQPGRRPLRLAAARPASPSAST